MKPVEILAGIAIFLPMGLPDTDFGLALSFVLVGVAFVLLPYLRIE